MQIKTRIPPFQGVHGARITAVVQAVRSPTPLVLRLEDDHANAQAGFHIDWRALTVRDARKRGRCTLVCL